MINGSPCKNQTSDELVYQCLMNMNASDLLHLPAHIAIDKMVTWLDII